MVPVAGGPVADPAEVWEEESVPEPFETPPRPFYHEVHGLKGAERRRYYHKFCTTLSAEEQATGVHQQMGRPESSATISPSTKPIFKMDSKKSVDEKELPSAEGHSDYHRETLILDGSSPTCSEAQIDQRSTFQVQTTWARNAAEGLLIQPFSILANQRSDADASQPRGARPRQSRSARSCQPRGAQAIEL